MKVNSETILQSLQKVIEPDLGKDIVSLGLVTDIKVWEDKVSFSVQMKNAAMHARKRMQEACEFAIERSIGKDYSIEVNVQAMKKAEATKSVLPNIKNTIATNVYPKQIYEDVMDMGTLNDTKRIMSNNVKIVKSLRMDQQIDALHDFTLEDARLGRMSWPRQLAQEDFEHYVLSSRFGIVQGVKENGQPKVRSIDDFSRCPCGQMALFLKSSLCMMLAQVLRE